MTGRVTVDIDGYVRGFELLAIRSYYNLKREADEIEVRISSGGSGIHLVGYFNEELPFSRRIQYRRMLGDDQNRIKIDIERFKHGVYTGVLWSEKDVAHPDGSTERGTAQRDFGDIHDALDHIRMTRTDPQTRMKRLANEGHRAAPDLARHLGGSA